MSEPVICLHCLMINPPPEMTCNGGTPGGIPRDHFVGVGKGCQHCGRLVGACVMRPCQAVRAMWHALEDGRDGD